MNTKQAIEIATRHLQTLPGHLFDVIDVSKPVSPAAATFLSRVISKLSPLVGNLIEFNTCEFLNDKPEFGEWGNWRRQDPGFPDTVFEGKVLPTPGFEIKAWFPLATEITARFKDSQNHFAEENTHVAMLAWLPESLVFGKPKIIDIVVVDAGSIAKARDAHYHDPPNYIVVEPGDTTLRSRNLRQTTTAGYIWQAHKDSALEKDALLRATSIVESWGEGGRNYLPTSDYQVRLKELLANFTYRADTNFAKMDRIVHPEIEAFKARVYGTNVHGLTIGQWNALLSGGDEEKIKSALADRFDIRDVSDDLVEPPTDPRTGP